MDQLQVFHWEPDLTVSRAPAGFNRIGRTLLIGQLWAQAADLPERSPAQRILRSWPASCPPTCAVFTARSPSFRDSDPDPRSAVGVASVCVCRQLLHRVPSPAIVDGGGRSPVALAQPWGAASRQYLGECAFFARARAPSRK